MPEHNAAFDRVIHPVAQDAFAPVPTALICKSTLLCSGIRQILSETRFALTAEAPEDAEHSPVLILIAGSESIQKHVDTISRLRNWNPSARLVVLTDQNDTTGIIQLFEAGLHGLCPMCMPRDSLIKALELVALGGTFMASKFTGHLLSKNSLCRASSGVAAKLTTKDPAGSANGLSPREAQILRYLMQGASNKRIAQMLCITESAVRSCIKGLLRKVQATNRTQAALWAAEHMSAELSKVCSPKPEGSVTRI